MNPRDEYRAFCAWLEAQSGGSAAVAASLMLDMVQQNTSRDNCVWEFLEATGESDYTVDTFIHAAEIALGKRMPENDEHEAGGIGA